MGSAPGPAPARHALARTVSATLSSWRTWPKVNERRNVPSVDGAITQCGRTASVAPARSTCASSMQSPPATIDWTRVITLRPGRAAAGRSPRSTTSSTTASTPSLAASVAVMSKPALATPWESSKVISARSRAWEDRI